MPNTYVVHNKYVINPIRQMCFYCFVCHKNDYITFNWNAHTFYNVNVINKVLFHWNIRQTPVEQLNIK